MIVLAASVADEAASLVLRDASMATLATAVVTQNTAMAKVFSVAIPGNVTPGVYSFALLKAGVALSESAVEVQATVPAFLVQTDKPIYKPGHTVRFRVLGFSKSTAVAARPTISAAVVYPARGFKLALYTATLDSFGVAEFDHPLPNEPLEGDYLIQVSSSGGAKAEVSFEVAKYVLPRFEVTLSLDKTLFPLGSAMTLSGNLSAKYTYGEDVKFETATVQIMQSMYCPEVRGYCDKVVQEQMLKELGPFSFTLAKGDSGMFQVVAVVLDAASKTTQEAMGEIEVMWTAQRVTFADAVDFHAGLPVEVSAKVEGTKPTNSRFKVTYRTQEGESYKSFVNFATNVGDGPWTVAASVPVPPDNATCCQPGAREASESKDLLDCCIVSVTVGVASADDDQSDEFPRIGGSDNLCVGRAYSSSGQSLRLSGDTVYSSVKVYASRGIVTSYGQVMSDKADVVSGVTEIVNKVDISDAGETGETRNALTTEWSIWKGSIALEIGDAGVSYIKVLSVTDSNGVTVAAREAGTKAFQFNYESSVSVAPGSALPGSNVTVTGTGMEGSKLYLVAVDKAVELMGSTGGGEVTAGTLQSAAALDQSAVEISERMYKECHPETDLEIALKGAGVSLAVPATTDRKVCTVWQQACYSFDFDDRVMVVAMAGPPIAEEGGMAVDAAADDAGVGGLASVKRVRSFFPEAWLWESMEAGGAVTRAAPDSLTTWLVKGWAMHPEKGPAVCPAAELVVKKDLYTDLALPYSIIRGETVTIQLMVVSHLDSEVECTLTLTSGSGISLGSYAESVRVAANGVSSQAVEVTGTNVGSDRGTHVIKATVQTSASVGLSDAVERVLMVRAEGIPTSSATSAVIDLTSAASFAQSLEVSFPANAVADSQRAELAVVGDLLGPSVNNLERLVKVPFGCGEQNMISLAPNVYVMSYKTAVGQLSGELKSRLLRNMLIGYQRELTYSLSDGSFSAFGESDKVGSTWLTAFVVRVFAESKAFISVDVDVLNRAAMWLASKWSARGDDDGQFVEDGRVIHSEMTGGASGGLPLTAYVLLALTAAKNAGVSSAAVDTVVSKAALRLRAAVSELEDKDAFGYVVAWHALGQSAVATSAEAAAAVLRKAATEIEGQLFWASSSSDGRRLDMKRLRPSSRDVEATAYAIKVLTANPESASDAFKATLWLIDQRSATGGFQTTQDTVVGLDALADFAKIPGRVPDMTVEVNDQSLSVTQANMDVMQTASLAATNAVLPVSASGKGQALVSITTFWNQPPSNPAPCFKADLRSMPTTKENEVKLCYEPTPTCKVGGMVIANVGLFSGMVPTDDSIEALQKLPFVDRVEVESGAVQVYLKNGKPACFQFNTREAFKVSNRQAVSSSVYDYYHPETAKVEVAARWSVKSAGTTIQADPAVALREGTLGMANDNGGTDSGVVDGNAGGSGGNGGGDGGGNGAVVSSKCADRAGAAGFGACIVALAAARSFM